MDDVPLYVQEEAMACLQLAQDEAQAEMKVVLMGMAYGWLAIAKEWRRPTNQAGAGVDCCD
jgi:hypothetical protein